MKINKEKIKAGIKTIIGDELLVSESFINLNLDKGLSIDGYQKLNSYTTNSINLMAHNKTVYIKGSDMLMYSYNKGNIQIKGNIQSIEIFEVE